MIQVFHHRGYTLWVEMPSRFGPNEFQRTLQRPWLLVRPFGQQRVEYIGDGNDTRL